MPPIVLPPIVSPRPSTGAWPAFDEHRVDQIASCVTHQETVPTALNANRRNQSESFVLPAAFILPRSLYKAWSTPQMMDHYPLS